MYALKGIFIDTPTIQELRVRDGYMLVEDGLCLGYKEILDEEIQILDYSGKLILPGMSDLHLHAPQYHYAGTAMDLELLEWLNTYTFPQEARFKDLEFAKKAYSKLVADLKQTSTTRFCMFGTIHTDSTLELMNQLEEAGFSGYVGKVNMDRNSPAYYCETSIEEGMKETIRWLDACTFKNIYPMITPRFTPSVSDAYMEALSKCVKHRNLPIQSHLSENTEEIKWVQKLCPDTEFYGQAYSKFGLFGKEIPTVMAHCIHSGEKECALMKENGVYIAHCPTSNENLVAGIAPAAMYLRERYQIGLGSDVAGGHTLNLFEVMKTSIQVSKLRYKYVDAKYAPLSMIEAFYMATVGGGSFFGKVGLFEEGYEMDAVVIEDEFNPEIFDCSVENRLEKYIYMSDGKVLSKFVKGKKIYEK